MGQLVFQANAGGQTALVGPNPSTSISINIPATNGNMVTTGDSGTVTNTMLASNVYTAPGTIGSGTPNTGAFTTLSASSTVSGTGFSNYLAAPPAIGGTTPSTGAFTTTSLKGSTSGTITLDVPAVAGTNTATFPAATGTVMVSGNMPAFSAYLSTNQSVTTGTWTKIAYDTEVFDTNNNFASSRFTPTVAGYYQITGVVRINSGAVSSIGGIGIYKNGSQYSLAVTALSTGTFGVTGQVISEIVYCNGSTDYIEMYGIDTSATTPFFDGGSGSQYVRISGALVRAA